LNKTDIKQAVILAGGRGKRLMPLTNDIPKPLAPINGFPFLDYLIYSILQVGIKNILILIGYKGNKIFSRYNNLDGINIEFSFGNEKDRTGRRLINSYEKLEDTFLLVYGDNYWKIELDDMINFYNHKKSLITTTVFTNKDGTGEYGYKNNIFVGPDSSVLKYDKKKKTEEANGVDIGYFIVAKTAIDPNISLNISFEEDILPYYILKNELSAYITDKQYYYITDISSIKKFEDVTIEFNFHPLPNKYFGDKNE
tara:strand:+ start:182 stop:943 length:762 start_codon:yes stop_codon:yes gene_type:complete